MNKTNLLSIIFYFSSILSFAQFQPKGWSTEDQKKANQWVNETYQKLSLDDRVGQLFIVALYTNKDENHINTIRNLVNQEHIGGIILMQDNAEKEIQLLNEFQQKSTVPLLIGMDAEWGLYQRIATAHKFPWAITLGAIQDNQLVYEMASKIAQDCKRMGVNWDFAPVVDVNTNPNNPIIGNRSFGSDVNNVTAKGLAYAKGLQDNGVLAAIKHFPGHGDTDTDSHLDLPAISHSLERLNTVELAPFKSLIDKGIGGIMVAHLYVPALEPLKGIPASISKSIITDLLKNKFGYQGLVITDALNMGAVAKRYQPGELDLKAFKAGNDIMLFSQAVTDGKRQIKEAVTKGEISDDRLEESVKKILLTKYKLGLSKYQLRSTENINDDLNNQSHKELSEKLYSQAITLLKDEKKILPLSCNETIYYVPLEEAPFDNFVLQLRLHAKIVQIKPSEISTIPANSKVLIGLHKDNTTAYKSYKISQESKNIIYNLAKNNAVVIDVFGSPYALKDIDISKISTVLISYENNEPSQNATAKALFGKTKIVGRLPVIVNAQLPYGMGIDK